jgi:hypothetical protein
MNYRALTAALFFGMQMASNLVPTVVFAQDYGPDTCIYGYVWREAYEGDHVCVRPWVRQRARDDNAAAPSRILMNGQCVYGYVWREANPDDHVCVRPDIRSKTWQQNARGPSLFANGPH